MINSDSIEGTRTILVVEDDCEIADLLRFHLEKDGYKVLPATNGYEGLGLLKTEKPDLVILDIMLPELDGLEILRRLRADKSTAATPVMILSARKEELDRVLGLELGADDYVVKPFSVRELTARVRSMLRRLDQTSPDNGSISGGERLLQRGSLVLYPDQHRVTLAGELKELTLKEFMLLQLLMENAGRVLTRELLLEKIWGYSSEVDTRTVDVHIRYLRQKIEDDPSNPRYIATIRGVGYRFTDV